MLPTFPSRYWSSVGLPGVFSLAGWSPLFLTGFLVSRHTQGTPSVPLRYRYGGITLYAPDSHPVPVPLQHFLLAPLLPRRGRNRPGLGSVRFDRHYSGHRCFFLFLQVLRCFSSLRFSLTGSPIRKSSDQYLLAVPRRFSQLATSFFASGSLGILRALFLHSCARRRV